MSVLQWSPTANSNGNADPDINWQEGQAPSTVNDAGRSMMAAVAKWRDDNNGTLLAVKGTGNAYAVSTNQGIADLTKVFTLAFTASTTNSGAATLAVDINLAKPMRGTSGVDLIAGDIAVGVTYQAVYSVASGEYLVAALARGATDARYLSKLTGGASAGDLTITNGSPGLYLVPQGSGYTWRVNGSSNGSLYIYRPIELVYSFVLGPNGEISTAQFGDLNTRIETRAAAYAQIAADNANSRVARAGDNMTGDLTIGAKAYPTVNLLWGGVMRAGWMLDSDGSVMWRNADNGGVYARIRTNGAIETSQFGDLNTRIENRGAAFSEQARAQAYGYATNGDITGVNGANAGVAGANANANARVAKGGDTMTGPLAIGFPGPYFDLVYGGVLRSRQIIDGVGTWILRNGDNGDNFFYVQSSGAAWTKQFGDLNTRIENRASAYATGAQNAAYGYTDYYRNGNSQATSGLVGSSIVARDAFGRSVFNSGSADKFGFPMIENSNGRMGGWTIASGYFAVNLDGQGYGVSYFASDESYKDNIAPTDFDALGRIKVIPFVSFDFKPGQPMEGHWSCGVTAQRLQVVEPEWVDEMPGTEGCIRPDTNKLLIASLRAIQQLEARNSALEARVAALEARAA